MSLIPRREFFDLSQIGAIYREKLVHF
jgi:hypothetical protein